MIGQKRRRNVLNRRRVKRRVNAVSRGVRASNLRRDTHSFKRSFEYTVLDQTTAVNGIATGAWTFNLGNLPNNAEYTALFDRYMITYIKLYVYLRIDPGASAANTAHFPMMYIIRDYDDSSAPVSISNIFEHARVQRRMLQPNRPVVIKLKPATLGLTYNTAVSSTFSPQWNKWIDMANTTVPHYGLKWALENWAAPGTNVIVRGTMWFRCKDSR